MSEAKYAVSSVESWGVGDEATDSLGSAKRTAPEGTAIHSATQQTYSLGQQGLFSRTQLFWQLSDQLRESLAEQFDRVDLTSCGYIQNEVSLNLLATNVAYLAFSAPHNLKVGCSEIDKLIDLCLPLLQLGDPPGVNQTIFINLVVFAYGFKLVDGSHPERDLLSKQTNLLCRTASKLVYPDDNQELEFFPGWWDKQYGPDYLAEHPGGGLHGYDEQTEEVLEKAKLEYKACAVRREWEAKRSVNILEWRRSIREQLDVSEYQEEEEKLAVAIRAAKMTEKLAKQEKDLVGHSKYWIQGSSCIRADTRVWQACSRLRGDPGWQWFMLIVNLINVAGLMSDDTSCDPGACDSPYQDIVMPILDWCANVLFTIDMLNSMIVLGFASYFADAFNKLDFFVVTTGWLDAGGLLAGLDISALRALRVLRPMRLVKYFKGIQAILGAIIHNIEPIGNVMQFMLFFLIIFGIAGVTLFPGKLQHRCVVEEAYPSNTAGINFTSSYATVGAEAGMGEIMYFCTPDTERVSYPFPYRCASYMNCETDFGNPHHGATSFDNFGSALLLMFQVQTLSTWWEYDYATEMTIGWYATIFYQMIIFLVGFIVSQLFVAVVCFGFENLEEQLGEPTFSDAVIGLPYVELETDPEDNLCACLNKPFDPLDGAEKAHHDRGTGDGLRVSVQFLVHDYPPGPLDMDGCFAQSAIQALEANPAAAAVVERPLAYITTDVEDLTTVPRTPTPEAWTDDSNESAVLDPYCGYRKTMQAWKDDIYRKDQIKANRPFRPACETAKPKEIYLGFDALKTWSNQTVYSLEVMLRAQEQIDERNIIRFFHDQDGQLGEEMQNVKLEDLVQVENDTDMPKLVVHMRTFVRVSVEPLSTPGCDLPELSLEGRESICQVKQLCYENLKAQGVLDDSVELEDCRLHADGDTLVDEAASLYQVCLETQDGFDPMVNNIFFAFTIDKKEAFILSSGFDNTIIAIICLNSIFLAIDHYEPSAGFTLMLQIAEWIFNVVFTIEMGLKLWCMKGFCNYWRFNSNKFDFIIVASSWGNVFTESIGLDLAFMKVLRIFRALRVTRVLRKIESVRKIIDAAFDSMQPILNIMVFMVVVLIVYSCMGMQLYGGGFNFDGEPPPRENFDNFVMAFLGLFQVLTGSSWELVLYDCMRAAENSYLGVPFILSFFILCNYIILNLFIGAILANMGTGSDEQCLEMTKAKKRDERTKQRLARESQLFVNKCLDKATKNGTLDEDLTTLEELMEQRCVRDTFVTSPIEGTRFGIEINNCSMGCLSPQNCFRRVVYRLVHNDYFDFAILIVIVYSTVLLTFLNPDTARDEAWQDFFLINDIVFLAIFTVEFVMKLIAFGFIWTDNIEFMTRNKEDLKALMLGDHGVPSYMYESWNYLDLVVLVVSYINMFADTEGPLKILRLLRAFRPLRMVNRIDGMKLVIMSLVDALPALGNVCVLLFSVFLIFGILGLNLFVGKFQSCNDTVDAFIGGSTIKTCFGHVATGEFWSPKVWSNPGLGGWGECSFDNIFAAFMALFEVSSGDSWESVMYLMADVPALAGEAPYRDDGPLSNCLWAFFAVIFVFMGQLFLMQLFVSVIIDSFSLVEGSGLLTGDQNLVNDMTKYFLQLAPEPKPPVPEGWRSYFYLMFIDIRPLPVPGVQDCLDIQHIPQNRLVADHVLVKKEVDQARLNVDKHPKGKEVVEYLEQLYHKKSEDLKIFQSFALETLEEQQLPSGLLYLCGAWFDTVLTVCILLNIACMCTVHHNQSPNFEFFLWSQNFGFNVLFTFEMITKLIGLGFRAYWTSPFDAFDGFVVLASWIFAFVDVGAIAGIFRIGRVFRLVKRAPKLQNLMSTLVKTLPSITNVFMVLLLVFFIFAVIGVELFGKTRYGFGLNTVANFGTWSASMHTLWRAALGNWRGVMYDTMVAAPDCTMSLDGVSESMLSDGSKYNDCGDYATSCMFFVIFQVLATLCVLNLVVAIILNAFTWCYSLEPSQITAGLAVTACHLLHFKEIWTRFDLFGTGFIKKSELQFLMSIVQFNLPVLCRTGVNNQRDEPIYADYSSFGTGPDGTDRDASEAQARANYNGLVDKITRYERALEVHTQLVEEGIDTQSGDNTDIFNNSIDNGVILVKENCEVASLIQVRYSTLIMILSLDAVGLDRHDEYVCHNYRDPFKYRLPGYCEKEINNGRIAHRRDSTCGIGQGIEEEQEEEDSKQSPIRPSFNMQMKNERFGNNNNGTLQNSIYDEGMQFNRVGATPKPKWRGARASSAGSQRQVHDRDTNSALLEDRGRIAPSSPALPPLKEVRRSSLSIQLGLGGSNGIRLPGAPAIDLLAPARQRTTGQEESRRGEGERVAAMDLMSPVTPFLTPVEEHDELNRAYSEIELISSAGGVQHTQSMPTGQSFLDLEEAE